MALCGPGGTGPIQHRDLQMHRPTPRLLKPLISLTLLAALAGCCGCIAPPGMGGPGGSHGGAGASAGGPGPRWREAPRPQWQERAAPEESRQRSRKPDQDDAPQARPETR